MKKAFAIVGGIIGGAFALLGVVTVVDYAINEGYEGYNPNETPDPRDIMRNDKRLFLDYESEEQPYEND